YFSSQARHGCGQLLGSARGFAEPKRNRRRLALGILDPDLAGLDSEDPPRRVPELKYVALQAFDGEVLIDGPDRDLARLEYHLVVGSVGDGSARSNGGQTRASSSPQSPVDGIAMQVGAAAAAAGREPFGEHRNYRIKVGPSQIAIRIGAASDVV